MCRYRTQLTYLAYSKGSTAYFNLQYSYQQQSGYSPPCPKGTSGNKGSIQCIFDNVDLGRSVRFDYDPVQRITSAKTCGSSAFPQWSLAQSYDRFGNRLTQAVTAGSGPSTNMSFSNNNQPTGYTFDPSGNMTVEPLSPPNNMTYDGENRMTAFSGIGGAASYTYDGNGMRVVKSVQGGTATLSLFSGNSVIAEYDNSAAPGSPSREYIAGPTGLLAMFSGGATTYYHRDNLSVRLTTDGNGNIVTQQGHFPFGEQWYTMGQASKWFFTSYDRDSESGLDYALARYYNSRTGTFLVPDPVTGKPGDPQSWNRYPYGSNDPIDVTDPSGKFPVWGWVADALLYIAAPFTGGATLPYAMGLTSFMGATSSIETIANGDTAIGLISLAPAFLGMYDMDPDDPSIFKLGQKKTNAPKDHFASVSDWPKSARGFHHTGLAVDSDDTWGFSTLDRDTPWWQRVFGAPKGNMENDLEMHTNMVTQEVAPHSPPIHIPITADVADKISDAIVRRVLNPGRYNLIFNNCAQAVESFLHAGGISGIPYGAIFVPATLHDILLMERAEQ